MKKPLYMLGGLALAGLLGGCGSDSPDPLACSALEGRTIAAGVIGLPTSGARIVSAEIVVAAGEGAAALGEYCKLNVAIDPVDTSAPPIRMVLDMPTGWNHKGLMFGGGGYNGILPNIAGNVPVGRADVRYPLGQGYATFGSDSGHTAGALGSRDGSFGVNDEALQNFAGDALKKVHDTAREILRLHYAADPQRMYFIGGSTGGREALAVAQRWPDDWDGVIAHYPAWNAASLDLQFGRITRALAAPGAWPNPEQRRTLLTASLEACDGLDGVQDGLVSNITACNAQFDPATATVAGQPLRCANDASEGDHCLADAQIAALRTFTTRFDFPYALGSGETGYPGFNAWGSDLGLPGDSALHATIRLLAFGTRQPATPMPDSAPYFSVFWDQWVRHFITRDPDFDSLSLDPANPGVWQTRIHRLTALQDVNRTDLSAFRARGGKLLMSHGQADVLVATQATAEYYERLRATMGAAVQDFVRYYEIPGYGHAASTLFNAGWDSLAALENWVERGIAPTHEVVIDSVGVPGRSRPLCDYPQWPHYDGGDPNLATSFSCAHN